MDNIGNFLGECLNDNFCTNFIEILWKLNTNALQKKNQSIGHWTMIFS